MTIAEGRVGENIAGVGNGSPGTLRLAKTGDLVVTPGLPTYAEAMTRGLMFTGTTATTGVAPGTTLSTTAAFTLHNPQGSNKLFILVKASMNYISGTLGAGATWLTTHATGTAVASPTGTAIVPRNNLLGVATGSTATCLTTATVATQLPVKPLWNFGPYLATSVLQERTCEITFDGEYGLYPGFGCNLHSIAGAGTSPLVCFGMEWVEIPLT